MLRQRTAEWMDSADADTGELRSSLAFIERINRRLGYTRALISRLEAFSADGLLAPPCFQPSRGTDGSQAAASEAPADPRPISILDIATGSADVPRAILDWAQRRRRNVRVVGVDFHAITLQIARERSAGYETRLTLMRADALELPFADASFDYVITSMFLHHLDDREVVGVLRAADRIARRGLVVADLSRSRRALAWITLFTLFSNPMVKHDARVSVRQAFTPGEVIELARSAGVGYLRCHRHFGHRFVLAGTKGP